MTLVHFILVSVFLLLFEGVSSERVHIYHYHTPGEDTSLPCDKLKHHGPQCSHVNWFYNKDRQSKLENKVKKGQIVDNVSSSRLTLSSDCSLMVHNISVEDKGLFLCRQSGYNTDEDTSVYLEVLTVSPAPLNTSPNQDGSITLQCSLLGYSRDTCAQDSLRWLDINGTVLSGAGITQNKCVSNMIVERQSQHKKTFTCQYMRNGKVEISAGYSLEVNRETNNSEDPDPSDFPLKPIIYAAVVVALLVLLIVAVVVFFKIKSKKKITQSIEKTEGDTKSANPVFDPETQNNVTYAMINHQKPTAQQPQVIVEDSVTYSEVNIKTSADYSHSAIYSTVNKTTSK